ncbi:hypothetical protein ACFPZ0_18350 [Streptomonospora nanhaiensis]|uniref:Uncharacterized protein n=1 Tax=Streptomonospora nanhaiensis TaxID=1323731 RepID=A0A853BGP9_9ACTN|nr:hypothetical protein [Streptomonospora nanhaiensis]MBV2366276.1 hypothetical protein [Streptomonospora nanhaiensis]MBX9390357.1 hypothetical protein [Streptomonospora nanhaiensis]NYI93801.1 hypothetical protein [Streptomonospora nanhaiensis]
MDGANFGGVYFASLDPAKMPEGKDWAPTLASPNPHQLERLLEAPPDRVEVSSWRTPMAR